jgi:hypothetical protein
VGRLVGHPEDAAQAPGRTTLLGGGHQFVLPPFGLPFAGEHAPGAAAIALVLGVARAVGAVPYDVRAAALSTGTGGGGHVFGFS